MAVAHIVILPPDHHIADAVIAGAGDLFPSGGHGTIENLIGVADGEGGEWIGDAPDVVHVEIEQIRTLGAIDAVIVQSLALLGVHPGNDLGSGFARRSGGG